MKWEISYVDGVYEFTIFSSLPCKQEDTRRFDSYEEAVLHTKNLIDVWKIEEVQ